MYEPLPLSLSMEVKDLVRRMLTVDPDLRVTMDEILRHPWFRVGHTALPQLLPSLGTCARVRRTRARARRAYMRASMCVCTRVYAPSIRMVKR